MVVAVREYVHARRQILDVFVYAILLVMVGNGCLGVACHDANKMRCVVKYCSGGVISGAKWQLAQ